MRSALPHDELRRRASAILLVVSDCDGVLTDSGVYYSERGEELKRFSIRDGMGVQRLREVGIESAILTGERSPSVVRRAEKLSIRAYLGVRHKARALDGIVADHGLDGLHRIAYLGDDVNDLGVIDRLAESGLSGAPADAFSAVLERVDYRCRDRGGHGAFREFAEWLLSLRGAPQP